MNMNEKFIYVKLPTWPMEVTVLTGILKNATIYSSNLLILFKEANWYAMFYTKYHGHGRWWHDITNSFTCSLKYGMFINVFFSSAWSACKCWPVKHIHNLTAIIGRLPSFVKYSELDMEIVVLFMCFNLCTSLLLGWQLVSCKWLHIW